MSKNVSLLDEARASIKSGHCALAIAKLAVFLQSSPGHPAAIDLLNQAAAKELTSADCGFLLQRADDAFEQGALHGAYLLAEAVAEADPENQPALGLLVRLQPPDPQRDLSPNPWASPLPTPGQDSAIKRAVGHLPSYRRTSEEEPGARSNRLDGAAVSDFVDGAALGDNVSARRLAFSSEERAISPAGPDKDSELSRVEFLTPSSALEASGSGVLEQPEQGQATVGVRRRREFLPSPIDGLKIAYESSLSTGPCSPYSWSRGRFRFQLDLLFRDRLGQGRNIEWITLYSQSFSSVIGATVYRATEDHPLDGGLSALRWSVRPTHGLKVGESGEVEVLISTEQGLLKGVFLMALLAGGCLVVLLREEGFTLAPFQKTP